VSGARRPPAATRRELLAAAAAAGGALAGGVLLAGAGAASARARAPRDDAELLSHTLGMAQLGAYVYEAVFAERIITGGRRRALDGFDEQERAHVAALRAAVRARGGRIGAPPSSDADANRRLARRQIPERLGHLRGPEDALGLLIEVERSSIGSCFVALGGLTGADAITLVARIMGNDAQHEAILSLQRHALKLKAAAPYALVAGRH
jgi:ferritin-like protein